MTREEAINHIVNDCFIFLGGQLCVDADKKGRFCEAIGKGVSALCAQKEAEKNEPLTLDELREMDGEPVWCVSLINKMSEWAILRIVEMSNTWFIAVAGASGGYGDKDTYSETWLAYRHKKEVQE